ncbi:MAG: hypothetical protein GY835_22110 [bacterium]|nr:hypothetical protein [bacterium]
MFNDKQMELSYMLFDKLKGKFPDIQLADITEAAYDPSHIWVNVFMPDNEDREIALREMAAEISADILLDYGYGITISSAWIPDYKAQAQKIA